MPMMPAEENDDEEKERPRQEEDSSGTADKENASGKQLCGRPFFD